MKYENEKWPSIKLTEYLDFRKNFSEYHYVYIEIEINSLIRKLNEAEGRLL